MKRRRATDADLDLGVRVFRSATSKKAWTILAVHPASESRDVTRYDLSPAGASFAAGYLYIEVEG